MTRAAGRVREIPATWRRVTAGLVDLLTPSAAMALLLVAGVPDLTRWAPTGELPLIEHVAQTWHATRSRTILQWLLWWLPLPAYHLAFAVADRRTPGAALLGLRTIGPDGHEASVVRRAVRGVLTLLWPMTLGLAAAWAWVTPSQRGPVDWLSGTCVVRDPARRRGPRTAADAAGATDRPDS